MLLFGLAIPCTESKYYLQGVKEEKEHDPFKRISCLEG
jgi:hypothetical protein